MTWLAAPAIAAGVYYLLVLIAALRWPVLMNFLSMVLLSTVLICTLLGAETRAATSIAESFGLATLLGADGSSFADEMATSTNMSSKDESVDFIGLASFRHSIGEYRIVVRDGFRSVDVV